MNLFRRIKPGAFAEQEILISSERTLVVKTVPVVFIALAALDQELSDENGKPTAGGRWFAVKTKPNA